ncbi:MAG TPA: SpvB/TcaC N-terminal domain-containing protein [Chitinophagaceae bacterium]|nr:SpvB/TcaC N-terminal domain-containing protein [Chitinophagaceae bacterium]
MQDNKSNTTTSPKKEDGTSDFLKTDRGKTKSNAIEVPSVSLPKGGGALKGIDEKFSVNAVNGTAAFSVPLPFSAARGASPSLSLAYNSGAGNGIFGLGWNIGLPSIKRKTDKGLPQYIDVIDSDTFLFSEAEDLVPEFKKDELTGEFIKEDGDYKIKEKDFPNTANRTHTIRFYRPRIEGLFARIERWMENSTRIIKWRVITKDNLTTLFGWSSNSVIADPKDNKKIFEWLPEFVFDDKGNCSHYVYKTEDNNGFNVSLLHNRNRFTIEANKIKISYTNIYLEKVLYGNQQPYKKFGDPFPEESEYLFSSVFDYGTLKANDRVDKINDWDVRTDAFSDYKAGFEIRTTRLCKRVLLFHHFPDPNEYEGLVKSINFEYDTVTQTDFTFLKSMQSIGYIKIVHADNSYSYSQKSLPAIEFKYQKHDWDKKVKTIFTEDLVHAPVGLDEQQYQFTDLFNEGLSGILTEQANGWYYKHNLGDGKFEQAKLVSPKPSFAGLGQQLQLADLDGDGGKQLVSYGTEPKGYFELDDDNDWQPFRNFKNVPNIDFGDENTRMLDLNGDGKPEVLITDDNVFTWYQSDGRNGYSLANKTIKSFDEEAGPYIVFADQKQSIFLADMSGDGMSDIVRIRNGDICYWPNLGYGKFGTKVAMDNAPLFDHPDSFNPAFLRLADIDGSGTTDIIYLGKNKFTCWLNLSGNTFSTSTFEINAFPDVHNLSKITITDLLGNGVACIVWSSNLAKDCGSPLKYIDLMNSKKPHIMVSYINNMGKEVSMEYTASTKFYIEDKKAGKPWITKLHFPVHCVSKTETVDKVTGWKFISSYKYHHGYYDHPEGEFRGFGMVEQTDAENFQHWAKSGATNITNAELHQEPVISKTWFHTGAFLRKDKILTQFADEYWYEEINRQGYEVTNIEIQLPDARLIGARGIPDSIIDNLSAEEWRQGLRACKSMTLRSEVFAHDAPAEGATEDEIIKQLTPYSVATHNCIIELLQPKGKNKHAIFIVKESEAITYSYERSLFRLNPGDPWETDVRIAHNLNIKLDEYGNVLESAAVVYPRLIVDASLPAETRLEQNKNVIIYTQNSFTNPIKDDVTFPDVYRLPLPSEVKTFELKGVVKTNTFYTPADFKDILSDLNSDTVNYHEIDKALAGKPQKRLIEHIRFIFYRNNLTGPLPLHHLESLAIPYEGYQLAYTPELLTDIFGLINVAGSKVNDALMTEGKFSNSEGDNNWWVYSGTMQFIAGAETAPDAQNRFYVPVSYTDPYGATTKVKYYSNYFLLIKETEDALQNKSQVDLFNFRTLSPQRIRDINNNLSEVIVDELGLVKAMAVSGKGNEADDLSGLSDFTLQAEKDLVNEFFNVPDTPDGVADSVLLREKGRQLLNHATARFVYDFEIYRVTGKPTVVASIVREEHFQKNNDSPVQLSFEYSNGIGKVVMKKTQAEPGLAKKVSVHSDNTFTITDVDTSTLNPGQLRWVGNGRTMLNNKGNPVKQYEPYFSVSNRYEDLKELVETGVTPILYYDAMGRVIKTKMPDDTFSKLEFDSWKQIVFDANDTILESGWHHNRANGLIDAELAAAGKDPDKEKIAADKAAKHANTPNVLHYDTLGRPVLLIDHNKNIATDADEFYRTKIKLDTEGNLRNVTDARELAENASKGNIVMQYKYDMLGNLVYQNSMDAGQRWLLLNILGQPLRTWDERDHEFQYFYEDPLHRPTHSKVTGGDGAPLNHIFDRILYGESLLSGTRTDANRFNESDLQLRNVLGKEIKHYDTGGLIDTPDYDFKGQPLFTTRKLFIDYKSVANWIDENLNDDLEPGPGFTFATETDALDRITKQTTPDESIITPLYNEAGLLNGETVAHINPAITTTYIKDIDYNEKGQRNKIIYGNDVSTKFFYDKETFRLKRLESKRQNNEVLQDLFYTFDPVGNITAIEDKAIPISFFANTVIEPLSEFTYDALYRIVEATGRENSAALNFGDCDNWDDRPFMHSLNPGDPMAVRNYTQHYQYDAVGNILEMKHVAAGGNWTRGYTYETANNRLKTTNVGDNGAPANYTKYTHHAKHGFLKELPHLEKIDWNFKEEVVLTSRQHCTGDNIPVITYYQYDGQGQRIRKITENSAPAGGVATKKEERIYVAGYELYKKHSGTNAGLERISLSLLDEGHRFVMIETRNDVDDGTPKRLVRYQLHNHLGSASLELDGSLNPKVISYEEYHPFGTTAYQATNSDIKSAVKRYRNTGMERDEETGLEYHSARYYLPWLGRWLSADPIGIGDGVNLYAYAKNNPTKLVDPNGHQAFQQFSGPISGHSAADLNIATITLFGEMSPRGSTADLTGEAHGIASVMFNRMDLVAPARAAATLATTRYDAARTEHRSASSAMPALRNAVPTAQDAVAAAQRHVTRDTAALTRASTAITRLEAQVAAATPRQRPALERRLTTARAALAPARTQLATSRTALATANRNLATAISTRDAGEARLTTAGTNLRARFAEFETARDARTQAESFIASPSAAPTLTQVVTAPGARSGHQFDGLATGRQLFADRNATGARAWGAATRTLQEKRWAIARAAVASMAAGGSRDPYLYFISNFGGTRTLPSGETRIGGTDFRR